MPRSVLTQVTRWIAVPENSASSSAPDQRRPGRAQRLRITTPADARNKPGNGQRPSGPWSDQPRSSCVLDLLEGDKFRRMRSGTNVSFNVSAKSPTNCVSVHESLVAAGSTLSLFSAGNWSLHPLSPGHRAPEMQICNSALVAEGRGRYSCHRRSLLCTSGHKQLG
jgi:hypothetical protein